MTTVTSSDGTLIDFDRYGSGPAVIMIGGATQHRALDATGGATAKLLAEAGFTVVDYDRRGRGRSGDTAPWALEREVEDLAALIDAVGGAAALLTSSSGATVALAAGSAGIGVTALALYEPPFFPGADHTDDLVQLHRFLDAGDRDGAMRYNLASIIGIPADAVAGMAGGPWWPTMVAVAPTLPYDIAAVSDIGADPDWVRRWSAIEVPVLVMSGDQTFPGMPEAADAVAAALPHAERRILVGQDHGPAAGALVPVVAEFLRGSIGR